MRVIKVVSTFALLLLVSFFALSRIRPSPDYDPAAFLSSISAEECFLCGDAGEHIFPAVWGQDNLGLLNVNTFDVQVIEINLYDHHGVQIKENQGYMAHRGGMLGTARVSSWTDPDRGVSHVDIQDAQQTIDPDAIGAFLCQGCLDNLAEHYLGNEAPSEVAVINFATREIRLLTASCTWFTFDNYAVDCDFGKDDSLDLLLYYCPPRFQAVDDNGAEQPG